MHSDGAVLCHQIATLGPLSITEQGQMEDQNPLSLGPREFGKVTQTTESLAPHLTNAGQG